VNIAEVWVLGLDAPTERRANSHAGHGLRQFEQGKICAECFHQRSYYLGSRQISRP
jgi:hypothetical protein